MSAGERAHVLIVEDESVVAMAIEAAVEAAGHTVDACVPTVGAALAILDRAAPGVAWLDVLLRDGEYVYPLAAELMKRGIPFALMTGYAAQEIDPAYSGCIVLQKPFAEQALAAVLQRLVSLKP